MTRPLEHASLEAVVATAVDIVPAWDVAEVAAIRPRLREGIFDGVGQDEQLVAQS